MKYKISKSNNPTITIGKSYVQLITGITSGYQNTNIDDVPYWQLYCREPREHITRQAVTLDALVDIVAELDTQQHATYNAYPRGSLRRNRHYYCRVAYGQLKVYTLHDNQIAYVYNDKGDVVWSYNNDSKSKSTSRVLRRRYFRKENGDYTLDLWEVDHSSRDKVARRFHNDF